MSSIQLSVHVLDNPNTFQFPLSIGENIGSPIVSSSQQIQELNNLAGLIEDKARTIISKYLPGWPRPNSWYSGISDNFLSFRALSPSPRPSDSISIFLYYVNESDNDAMKYLGVYGFHTVETDPAKGPANPLIVLRLIPGKEDRLMPTLVHELGHYIRFMWRNGLEEDINSKSSYLSERALQEGLAESLVAEECSLNDVIHQDPLSDDQLHSIKKQLQTEIAQEVFKPDKSNISPQEFIHLESLGIPMSSNGYNFSNDSYLLGFKVVQLIIKQNIPLEEIFAWDSNSFLLVLFKWSNEEL